MSNFVGIARTNYVTVEDVEGLKEALSPWPVEMVLNAEGKVSLLDDDPDGTGWPTFAQDDDGNDIELDIETVIMPFVKEGEVLVLMEAGYEKKRYVSGWAVACVRRADSVHFKRITLGDIYQLAADAFGVRREDIAAAEY